MNRLGGDLPAESLTEIIGIYPEMDASPSAVSLDKLPYTDEIKSLNWTLITPILDALSRWNLQIHIDEVLENIFGVDFEETRKNKGISKWSQATLISWLMTLRFLKSPHSDSNVLINLVDYIEKECISGDTFSVLIQDSWSCGSSRSLFSFLSASACILLRIIISHWALGIQYSLPSKLSPSSIAAIGGYINDYRGLDLKLAQRLQEIDKRSLSTGEGSLYGQVVVLGYSEYRMISGKWLPFGIPNNKFAFTRRKVSNGLRRSSQHKLPETAALYAGRVLFEKEANDSTLAHNCIDYYRDPCNDMFQLGRAIKSTNDLVIPGQLHLGEEGVYTGPVSRWACRIECERLAPFRSFIFAGGFNDANTLFAKKAPHVFDGFTTYGVRLLQPEVGEWVEVSVLGEIYEPRSPTPEMQDLPIHVKRTKVGNQLTNGTLIDICGIILLFQDPISMSRTPKLQPEKVIESLNALRPQCPVLAADIKFSYANSKERVQRAIQRSKNEDLQLPHIVSSRFLPIHVPFVDYTEVSEENRSYVFPSCGHIFGYHKSLEGKPCPLCRKLGAFVPLAFEFEAAVCDRMPTHVFNPCGHASSLDSCQFWAKQRVLTRTMPDAEFGAICPYCGGNLDRAHPFSRLILQTEAGETWCLQDEDWINFDESDEYLERSVEQVISSQIRHYESQKNNAQLFRNQRQSRHGCTLTHSAVSPSRSS